MKVTYRFFYSHDLYARGEFKEPALRVHDFNEVQDEFRRHEAWGMGNLDQCFVIPNLESNQEHLAREIFDIFIKAQYVDEYIFKKSLRLAREKYELILGGC